MWLRSTVNIHNIRLIRTGAVPEHIPFLIIPHISQEYSKSNFMMSLFMFCDNSYIDCLD